MYLICLLLGISSLVPAILAGRGSGAEISPTVCNSVPTVAVTTSVSAPSCTYAADPDGGSGLCANLADGGWCVCGSAGDYPPLSGSNGPCGYTSLPASTLSLSSTSCSSTTTVVSTITVSPVPSTAAKKRSGSSHDETIGRRRSRLLVKRQGGVVFSNCESSPEGAWAEAGFSTKRDVLQQAYNDAVTLARQSQNADINSKGFTHYFGGTGAQVQFDHFQKMMSAIASDTKFYSITFECEQTPSCGKRSLMVTDATAGGPGDTKVIQVCPAFWTAATTAFLLFNEDHVTPSPPYRRKDDSAEGWCRKDTAEDDPNVSAELHQFFATAGHTILHELTHLDSLAEQAGLSADADNQHGTLDRQRGCELDGARKFLQSYNAGRTMDTSPDYNAESYAAAATEIYFMALCGFSQIKPATS